MFSPTQWLRKQYHPIGDNMVWPVLGSLSPRSGFRDGVLYLAFLFAAVGGTLQARAYVPLQAFGFFLAAAAALYGVALFAALRVGSRLKTRNCADDFLVVPTDHGLFARAFIQHFFMCTCYLAVLLLGGSLVWGASYYVASWLKDAGVSFVEYFIGMWLGCSALSIAWLLAISPFAWSIYFGHLAGGRLALVPYLLTGAHGAWMWWVSVNGFEISPMDVATFQILLIANMVVFGYLTYQYLRMHYPDRLRARLFP